MGNEALNLYKPAQARAHIVSALAIGTIALLILGLQPILLGGMVDAHSATLEGVGVIAMSEIIALGLGVALCDALMPLSPLRLISIVAALCVSTLDIATMFSTGDTKLAAVRSVAGLGEGVLLWTTTCLIVRSHAPDRIAGIFLVSQTLAQAALAAILAGVVIPRAGWQGGFAALAAVSLLPCLAVAWLPAGVVPLAAQARAKFSWSVMAALPLAVALLQMAAIGALWAYLEPLGKRAGFDAQAAQAVASGVLFMQLFGGVSASLFVRRMATVRTLIVGALALGVIPLVMHRLPTGATTRFALLCGAFGFAWLFLMPFHISFAFRADPTGRVAMLIPAMQLLGSAFGPLVASLVLNGNDPGPVPYVSLGFAVAAMVLLCAGQAKRSITGPLAPY